MKLISQKLRQFFKTDEIIFYIIMASPLFMIIFYNKIESSFSKLYQDKSFIQFIKKDLRD